MIKWLTKRMMAYGALVGISVFFFVFLITTTWIGFGVRERCEIAQSYYEDDPPEATQSWRAGCVESLIVYLEDESQSYRDRNSAIWALGQLGDARALPALEKLYTGNIPAREPIDGGISQYELSKAIALARGGFNIGAPIWRVGFLGIE